MTSHSWSVTSLLLPHAHFAAICCYHRAKTHLLFMVYKHIADTHTSTHTIRSFDTIDMCCYLGSRFSSFGRNKGWAVLMFDSLCHSVCQVFRNALTHFLCLLTHTSTPDILDKCLSYTVILYKYFWGLYKHETHAGETVADYFRSYIPPLKVLSVEWIFYFFHYSNNNTAEIFTGPKLFCWPIWVIQSNERPSRPVAG